MRVLDLFAGCGGMSLGFQNAGFEIVGAFDDWKAAVDVYRANFKHPVFQADLKEPNLSFIASFYADIIIGGPPCQDFSSAGKRDESLGRADLTHTFADIVCTLSPSIFVMENVERIQKSSILPKIIQSFQENGYGLTQVVLNAAYFGVPQERKRYFLIGEKNGKHQSFLSKISQPISASPTSIYQYLGDRLNTEYYYRHPRSYARRGIFSIHEPSPTIRGVNRPIPATYTPHPADATHNISEVRPLTTYERSLIQTFPPDFTWLGSKSEQEQLIGNAVPVKLAEHIGRSIFHSLREPLAKDFSQLEMFS